MQLEQFNIKGDHKKKGASTIHNVINTNLDDNDGIADGKHPGDQHVSNPADLPHQRLTNFENMENAKYM